ncbi:MAG: hypothetical protein IH984_07345 [Planctomycetes bacterium]|nr:hypothetical protein [Planctomycetota bacterium]
MQATLAVVGLELLRRAFRSTCKASSPKGITLDVVLPIAIVFPLALQATRVENSVSGFGWIAIGGPVVCGLVAAGCSLIVSKSIKDQNDSLSAFSIVMWLASGVILLLLAAANELTIPVGQCVFAIAAISLWLNTPTDQLPNDAGDNDQDRNSAGFSWVLGLGVAQALVALFIEKDLARISSTLMMVYAIMALAIVASLGGPLRVLRVGGWVACYGVFFAIGFMTLMQLVPMARVVLNSGDGEKYIHVAKDFWIFAPESVMLIALACFPMLLKRLSGISGLIWGGGVLVFAIAWCVWKLALIPAG